MYLRTLFVYDYLCFFRVVNQTGKHNDAQHQKEHQQSKFLSWSFECMNEDFQTRRVACEFKKSQDSDNADEVQELVFLVVDADHVDVETQSCGEIYYIYWGFYKLYNVWRNLKQ